jgi:hypothetical protein
MAAHPDSYCYNLRYEVWAPNRLAIYATDPSRTRVVLANLSLLQVDSTVVQSDTVAHARYWEIYQT